MKLTSRNKELRLVIRTIEAAKRSIPQIDGALALLGDPKARSRVYMREWLERRKGPKQATRAKRMRKGSEQTELL